MTVLFLILVISCSSFRFLGEVNVQIDLGKVQIEAKVIVVSAEVVQILIDFQVVFGLIVEGVPFQLGLGTAFGARPLDGDLGRRCGRRIRLKESSGFFRRGEFAIEQLEENGLHDLMISRQFGGNAHLLHQGVRNALAGFWPDFEEEIKAFLDDRILAGKPKP